MRSTKRRKIRSDRLTSKRSFERELSQKTLELEGAYRDFEAFAHSIFHDLRAPLRAIEGFSSLLLRTQQGKLDAEGEDQLRSLGESTQRMRHLFEGLSEFSRIGERPLRRRMVDVEQLVRAVLDERNDEAARRSVIIEVEALPPAIGDPSLLKRAFSDLLDNALKYSRQSSPAKVRFGAIPGPPSVYFVTDNGVGFDMREKNRLFRLFQRLHDHSEFEGRGIGLAIVASIAKRHGGRTWAESTPGEGTTFYLTLSR